MFALVLTLLAADPSIRIDNAVTPFVTVGKKTCAAGPHARLYLVALRACADPVVSAELGAKDLVVRGANGVVVCAVRPPELALRNEAAECLKGR